jgi:ubiquinone/menaquinone biosynthesis C-methylase UbiE
MRQNTPTQLNLEQLQLSAEEVGKLFSPYVISRPEGAAAEAWQSEKERRAQKYRQKYWRRRFLDFLPSLGRTTPKIEEEYNEVWDRTALDSYKLPNTENSEQPWEWGDKHYIAHRFGGARVRIAVLMRAIEQLKPASVLEVGCGNGVNLFYLAGRFPQIKFTGIELTEAGNRTAKRCQEEWSEFPEDLLPFSPLPLLDRTAFRRIDFQKGSAAELPFADNSFDLVITVLALEQMERIRRRALTEIARVSGNHVLMIEPFRDVNESGMRRHYVFTRNYFSARISDLPKYGLEPQWSIADFPQKVQMQFTCVLAHKKR